ncbi:MAG: hypothetical protein ABJF88_19210 [Rhodothermales bacterium]
MIEGGDNGIAVQENEIICALIGLLTTPEIRPVEAKVGFSHLHCGIWMKDAEPRPLERRKLGEVDGIATTLADTFSESF